MFKNVKAATVALVHMHEETPNEDDKKPPFTIVGTGFCVHSRGIVVTCEHVLSAFMEKPLHQQIAEIPKEDKDEEAQPLWDMRTLVPHALFFDIKPSDGQLLVAAARLDIAMAKTNYDLAMFRVHPHAGLPNGFPSLEIENYDHVEEGMEIATCGFPLGNLLGEQIGTVTSSFTRGIVSSIIPAPSVPQQYLKGFQLNLTATHGNSGGPVFSLATGKVFGVLQRGVKRIDGQFMQGITKAEPIYPLFAHESLERFLHAPLGQILSFSGNCN